MSILEHFVKLKSKAPSEILITDKKVGDILIEHNLINAKQLKQALHYQQTHPDYNGRVGEICVELGWINKIDLIKVVSEHYHIPLAIAILEKREIAKKMQAQEARRKKIEETIDNDFIDSLSAINPDSIEFSFDLPSQMDNGATQHSKNKKIIQDNKPDKNTTNNKIIDLVLTKRLQNGLISTKNSAEQKSIDYISKLIRSSDPESALTYIEKIKQKYAHSASFCQIHVFALIHNHLYEQADTCLSEFDPDFILYPQLLDLKSVIHQLLDQHELAVKNFTAIIQTKKLSAFCYFSLAYSLDKLNLSNQATKIFKHFMSLANSNLNKQMVYAQSKC